MLKWFRTALILGSCVLLFAPQADALTCDAGTCGGQQCSITCPAGCMAACFRDQCYKRCSPSNGKSVVAEWETYITRSLGEAY